MSLSASEASAHLALPRPTKGVRAALVRWAERASPEDAPAAFAAAKGKWAQMLLVGSLPDAALLAVTGSVLAARCRLDLLDEIARRTPFSATVASAVEKATVEVVEQEVRKGRGEDVPRLLGRFALYESRARTPLSKKATERLLDLLRSGAEGSEPSKGAGASPKKKAGSPADPRESARGRLAASLLCWFLPQVGERWPELYSAWQKEGMPRAGNVAEILAQERRPPLLLLRQMVRDAASLPHPHWVYHQVVQNPQLRRDPEIRALLLPCEDAHTLFGLRDVLTSSKVPDAFLRLARLSPQLAGNWLRSLSTQTPIAEEAVALLLSCSCPETRLRALTWWGARRTRLPTPSPTPERVLQR